MSNTRTLDRTSAFLTLPLCAVLSLGAATLFAQGCKEKGTMEKAGAKVDQAAKDAGASMDKAAKDVGEKMDEAGKEIEKAVGGE